MGLIFLDFLNSVSSTKSCLAVLPVEHKTPDTIITARLPLNEPSAFIITENINDNMNYNKNYNIKINNSANFCMLRRITIAF